MNIVVPQLGESVIEARVARWLKKEGDAVAAGEPLVELETDKIDLEVNAESAGVLARIERKDGEDVKVGEVLGSIEDGPGSGVQPAKPDQPAQPDATATNLTEPDATRRNQTATGFGSGAGSGSRRHPRYGDRPQSRRRARRRSVEGRRIRRRRPRHEGRRAEARRQPRPNLT